MCFKNVFYIKNGLNRWKEEQLKNSILKLEQKQFDEIKGIYVYSVSENGGAEEAGIKEGDIITKIEDTEINSISQFLEIIGQYRPGNKIGIDVVRKGRDKSFNVTLRNENGDFIEGLS